MNSNLNLYVWPELGFDDDRFGLAFALAPSMEEAVLSMRGKLKVICLKYAVELSEAEPSTWGPCEVHPVDAKVAFAVLSYPS